MTKNEVINFLIPEANIVNSLCKNKQSVFMAQVIQESGWLEHAPGNNALVVLFINKVTYNLLTFD
jgi:flagellum-specific peptidoglycan hydrolase FlgJ